MKFTDHITANFGQKVLALSLAVILWFSVTMGQEGEAEWTAPVQLVNVPAGLKVEGAPERIEFTLAGPRYLLMGGRNDHLTARLDLKGTSEGPVLLAGLDKSIQVRRELRIIRIRPSTIELKIIKTGR